MFDPKTIRRGAEIAPRKMVLYGEAKIGKSTLAAASPESLLIALEDRVKHINTSKTNILKSYDEVVDVFEYLLNEQHNFKSLVIDSLDWLQHLLHAYICKKKGFKSLYDDHDKETNYGKGMKVHAVEGWKMFLQNCDILRTEKNMNIILVAHSQVEKISPPDADSFDRYTMKLDKNEVAVITEWADIIGFYNREKVIKKEDAGFNKKIGKALNVESKRILNLQATSPAWVSGNSYNLPDIEVTEDEAPEIMRYILNTDETQKTENKIKTKKGE